MSAFWKRYAGLLVFLGGNAAVCLIAVAMTWVLPGPGALPDTVRVRIVAPGVYRAGPQDLGRYTRPVRAERLQSAYDEFVAADGRKPHVISKSAKHIDFAFPSPADWERWEKRHQKRD